MRATIHRTQSPSDAKVRLRTEVFDTLTAARGATTNVAKAAMFDVDRSTIVRLRHGQIEAGLTLAMRMARRLGVGVEALFESGEAA